MIRPSIKTEIFVCDQCGSRKRLRTAARHWCDVCNQGSPVEMRPTRVKTTALKHARAQISAWFADQNDKLMAGSYHSAPFASKLEKSGEKFEAAVKTATAWSTFR